MISSRKFLKLPAIKSTINRATNDIDDDWVTIGVVVSRQSRKSKNGNDYSLWKLNDLQSDTMVSLFLFGRSNDKHWKIGTGMVIGLLNAKIMEESDSGKAQNKKEVSLTIDDPDKLLLIGRSKDMGFCKATKKDGQICNALISKADDEYCLYHIKNAYNKFSSKRVELQSSFSNFDSLETDMQFSNSVTGPSMKKIELAQKTIKSSEMKKKKDEECKKIDEKIGGSRSLAARNLVAHKEAEKDSQNGTSGRGSMKTFEQFFASIPNKPTPDKKIPELGKGLKRGQSLDFVVSDSQLSAAKRRAIEILKNKPIASPVSSPRILPVSKTPPQTGSKKLTDILNRVNKSLNCSNSETKKDQEDAKRARSEMIEKALARKSINSQLVDDVEADRRDAYFSRLEKKESMELKMMDTKQIKVKTVTCQVCRYTAQSQSDVCKAKGHRIETGESMKKFFQCRKCKNRTSTFSGVVPTTSCGTCGAVAWEKSGMMKVSTFVVLFLILECSS